MDSKTTTEPFVRLRPRISEAPSHGQPILIYDFKSTGAKAYLNLAREVLKREKEL